MVGHTGDYDAAIKAVETVDECIGKILDNISLEEYTVIITADHGNAEMILDDEGRPFTAHTTNKVPFGINLPGVTLRNDGKLANIAPTIISLLGDKIPEEMDEPSMIL